MASQLGMVDRSYLLQEQLGEGGMGTVYRAVQLVDGQIVALKLVPQRLMSSPEIGDGPGLEARLALAREFQTLASLHHPNVIRVLNYGFDAQNGPYFIMDLLAGAVTITDAGNAQAMEVQVGLVAQLLRALVYIHQRGVIHRDIKPGNVLVVGGEVKLLDFGIAVDKDEEAELGGSMEYMAPELLHGAPPTACSDLYSVGVLFHQMLTGTGPLPAASMSDLLNSILGEDEEPAAAHKPAAAEKPAWDDFDFDAAFPDDLDPGAMAAPASAKSIPPEISGPLGPIVAKLCAAAPEDRYADASVVLRELAAAMGSELPVETAATRESFLRANVLIGRNAELTMLAEALEQTKQGLGRGFLISGESGVGKSRLTAELRTLALVHGCWVAEGQSVTEGGYYYQEWLPLLRALCFRSDMTDAEASILKDLVGDIGELLGRPIPDPPAVKPDAAQARVVSTVVALLARQSKPVTLILEDLQWGRSESLAMLAQIASQAAKLPILLVVTQRSDEGSQLGQTVPELQLIQLSRLDEGGIAELTRSMLGDVGQSPELIAYLARQTEGNVFFLIETVRALAENVGELRRIGQGELPETVLTIGIERIIERRLEQVSADFRPLLEFAATLGRRLDLPVLEHAFPLVPLRSFLIECANAAVLESQGAEWRFAHNKLRENLLQRIAPDERRPIHEKVAYAIEAAYAGPALDALAGALAYHFQQAGVIDKALQYYTQAGDAATRLYLLEESRAHYTAAEIMLKQLPMTTELERLHVDLLLKQVHAGLLNDANDVQLRRLERARRLLETIPNSESGVAAADRLRMARVDYYTGRTYYYVGQPGQALPYYQRALPVGKEFGDQELMVLPSYAIGMALFAQGQFGQAVELLGQALEPIVQHYGISLDSIRLTMFHCCALAATGHCREALAGMARPQKWARDLGQPVYQGMFLTTQSIAFVLMADWPTAIQIARQLYALSKRSSEAMFQYMALDSLAWAHSNLGNHDEAFECRTKSVEIRRGVGGGLINDFFEAMDAELLLNIGRPDAALQQAQKVAASSQKADLPFSFAVAERAWGCALARLGGDLAEAEAHFATSVKLCQAAGQVMNAAQTELWWGRICREKGDEVAAEQHFATAIRQLEAGGYQYALEDARRIAKPS